MSFVGFLDSVGLLTEKWSGWRLRARLSTRSVVPSELLCSLSAVGETGVLLMYHCRRATGRHPWRLQLRLSLSPGEAEAGGLGRMAGPEGMAARVSSVACNPRSASPTTERISALVTVSKSGLSLLTSQRKMPPLSRVTG